MLLVDAQIGEKRKMTRRKMEIRVDQPFAEETTQVFDSLWMDVMPRYLLQKAGKHDCQCHRRCYDWIDRCVW